MKRDMSIVRTTAEGSGYKCGGKPVTAEEFDPRMITKFDRYTETDRMHQMNVHGINPGDEPIAKGDIERGAPIQ